MTTRPAKMADRALTWDDGAVGRRALDLLCEVTGDEAAATDLDLPLFESGVLDSLAVVTLMVAFEREFGLAVSPAEFDRQAWSTPRALVADVERRLAAAGSA